MYRPVKPLVTSSQLSSCVHNTWRYTATVRQNRACRDPLGHLHRPNARRRPMQPTTLRLDRLETRVAPAVAIWDGGGADNHWTTAAKLGRRHRRSARRRPGLSVRRRTARERQRLSRRHGVPFPCRERHGLPANGQPDLAGGRTECQCAICRNPREPAHAASHRPAADAHGHPDVLPRCWQRYPQRFG